MNELSKLLNVALGLASAAPTQSDVEPPAPPTQEVIFDVLVTNGDLRAASRKLFMDAHYAKAVEEGEKALIEHVQHRAERPDLEGTGAMTKIFSRQNPILQLNTGVKKWEQDEQEGYMHHFAGCVLMARNPRSHNYRLVDTPEKALAILAFINHLFDVVDAAQLVVPDAAGDPERRNGATPTR